MGSPYLFPERIPLEDVFNDHPDWRWLSRQKLRKAIKKAGFRISTEEIEEHINRKAEKRVRPPCEVFTVRFKKITLFD